MLHEYNSIFLETFTTAFKVCLFSGANIFPEKIAGCFDQIRRVARTINRHQNMPSTAARHLTKKYISYLEPPGGVLPSKRLLGMCRWMGSHFHNWIDYNGVTFSVELLEWGRTWGRRDLKMGRLAG